MISICATKLLFYCVRIVKKLKIMVERRELNSLSNSLIFHDYFFKKLRHTPNRYRFDAGCHETVLDISDYYRASIAMVETLAPTRSSAT
jgi:hypothetical protein